MVISKKRDAIEYGAVPALHTCAELEISSIPMHFLWSKLDSYSYFGIVDKPV